MNYPLITWQVDAPAFDVDGGSVGPFTSIYGFGYSGASTPPADTIAFLVYDALDNAGATSLTVQYTVDNTTGPSLAPAAIYYEYESVNPIVFTFSSLADAAVYGFDSTTVTFPASTSGAEFGVTPYNVAGLWAPSGVSGDVTRTTKQRAASSSSDMSGLTTDIVNWGQVADIEVRSTLFPAANAFRWYATQQIYATKAGRLVGDPNNILEVMLQAASTGVVFRIYEQDATLSGYTVTRYQIARMPGISAKSAATDFITADDEPRLWSLAGMFFRGEGG
jgi:hypothetical protein